MIDFHSHILPFVDDGSTSLDETLNLLKEAKDVGFDAIISTSHYMEGYYEVEEEERKNAIKVISSKLQYENIDINIYCGSEIYFSGEIPNLIQQNKASTINNTKYVLFELPINVKPLNIFEVIENIQKSDYIPILAHPERYIYMQYDFDLLEKLVFKGVLMQSNYGSILGIYGNNAKKIIKKMLKKGYVSFLGSDVHREKSIYLQIPNAIKKIEKLVGKEKFNELSYTNILKILK